MKYFTAGPSGLGEKPAMVVIERIAALQAVMVEFLAGLTLARAPEAARVRPERR